MIEDKAKEYAEGKALSAMTSAIEQAYIDGYNAGFQDGLNHQKPPIEVIDGVEYVDLGLPSGTKWSKTYFYDKGVLIIYSWEVTAILTMVPLAVFYFLYDNRIISRLIKKNKLFFSFCWVFVD